jgi:tRNA(Ile)-lysidine synthase TilS/MesJ
MRCTRCNNEAVFFQSYSGRHLCGRHLALDIEARAKRSIRSHHWMSPHDHIAVVVSGDLKSAALSCFLKKLVADRRDIRLSVLPSCGKGPGDGARSAALKIAELLGIPCIEMPLFSRLGEPGCSGVTKIALAVSLDDVAQGVLGQFLFGSAERLFSPPQPDQDLIPVICPFITIPSDELDIYGEYWDTGISPPSGTSSADTLRQETENLLEEFSRRHPATKYALLHLAEELSSGNVAGIAAAAGRGSPGSQLRSGGVSGNGS